jgi:hypothetical protein
MQGSMHAARVAPHLALRATLQLNPPRGRSAGGASSLGSAIEPDELPRRNPRPRSPPQLCVGKRTGIERGGRVCMDFLVLKPGKMYTYEGVRAHLDDLAALRGLVGPGDVGLA